jgi:WD40 repeat protein
LEVILAEFISYSRADTEFVRQLHERLASSGRDIWVDWEDIPLTADWWQEIQRGINQSDSFLFVISPDSVRSSVCRDEINYAVANNKRVVPILFRELKTKDDKDALHPIVSSHNWVMFQDSQKFDAAFENLITALDTDLEHTREHTRLLVRALEWDAAKRNASLLLRGTEVTKAEAWLTGSMDLHPEPTDLQTQFIIASRKAETIRQRRILLSVSVALVVALGLAIVSLFLYRLSEVRRQEAERLRLVAELRGQESRSLALAANARNLINDAENNLGLALAIAAYETNPTPLADVQQTLARAIYGPGARYRLTGHQKSVLDVAFSPGGSTAYSASADGTVGVWSLTDGTLKNRIPLGDSVPGSLAVSPDGGTLAVGLFEGTIRLLNPENGEPRRWLMGHTGLVTRMAFSPDGARLLSGSLDRTLRLWDVASGELLLQIDSPGAILNVAFSPDGRSAVSSSGDNDLTGQAQPLIVDRTVRVWDLTTGEEIRRFEPNSGFVRSVAFSPDGRRVAAGTWNQENGGRIHLWNVNTAEVLNTFYGHTDIITGLAFSADGKQLFSTSWDRTLRVWDVATALEVQRFQGHQDRVLALAVSPNGEYVLTGSGNAGNNVPDPQLDRAADPVVWLWDLKSRAQIRALEGHDDWVWSAALSPDDKIAATGSGPLRPPALDTSVRLWNVETGEQINRLDGHTDTVQTVTFSPDGQTVASASWDGTVRLWDIATGQGRVAYDHHTDRVLYVLFSADGQTAVSTSRDKTVHLWDVATGEEIRRFEGHTGAVNSADISPDGALLLTASDDRTVRLWDMAAGTEIRQFIGHSDRVNNVVFSPDGTMALSTSWDTSVRLWDVESGTQIRQFVGHNGAVFGVDFSPDGRNALTGSSDLTMRLWDVESGQEIRRFTGHTNWLLSVMFSSDGRFALSGAEDNTARLWRVETSLDSLVNWAYANRYVPELSCAEREQYNVDPPCDASGALPTPTPATA